MLKIPLLQEKSNELATIWELLAGVVTHAAAKGPDKSTRAPQLNRDAPRCMALFAATLPTRRPFKLHTAPPHPPFVRNTHRGATYDSRPQWILG